MSQESVKMALSKLIEHVSVNPGAAKVVFRAAVNLEEDVRCSARVRDFPPMIIDEPADLGGQDAGMNPVELILVALGACQEIMYAAYASFMGIKIDDLKVQVKGQLDLRGLLSIDSSVPAGYQSISYQTFITSAADEASIMKLIEIVEGHCPVMDILTRAQSVSGTAMLNGKELHSYSS